MSHAPQSERLRVLVLPICCPQIRSMPHSRRPPWPLRFRLSQRNSIRWIALEQAYQRNARVTGKSFLEFMLEAVWTSGALDSSEHPVDQNTHLGPCGEQTLDPQIEHAPSLR